ncbi:hypothetical protein MATR_11570 [Marivirga tractuosa]|uniref:Uncharacterized protein n=1 Tax=Marivirga tractuosa (strain ATCC 23168 / DSM 4126 / NBRC 15989 / NCIMB 1408 / VKM B-1430 / H-43) TaxID=643867 RepID=E4TKP7_MARTH|nr:hypothetical protein [Marivirga tractuosa]ADR21213.1 hypothetical protein Ftrac_1220 [Marivirga tractuosa DSM 4126]BDD14332.1 hypothetical protein MATR_11570 [Marivirga tractuosa]
MKSVISGFSHINQFLNANTQLKIRDKINESFKLKKQFEHLLEVAKKAVEMAIEQDENAASAWINDQTKDLELN